MKWISVEDELPEIDINSGFDSSEDVLIYGQSWLTGDMIVSVGWTKENDKWKDITEGHGDKITVTHWQPLPKPPKE